MVKFNLLTYAMITIGLGTQFPKSFLFFLQEAKTAISISMKNRQVSISQYISQYKATSLLLKRARFLFFFEIGLGFQLSQIRY